MQSLKHELEADAGARAGPPHSAGPRPIRPEPVISPSPAVCFRRRWQLGLQQAQKEHNEEFCLL